MKTTLYVAPSKFYQPALWIGGLAPSVLDRGRPSLILIGQAIDQALCQAQLLKTGLGYKAGKGILSQTIALPGYLTPATSYILTPAARLARA